MANLTTHYLGVELQNPVIVSSSGLTSTLENLKKCQAARAGAVVLKSLFEEQINHEAGREVNGGLSKYPEARQTMIEYAKENTLNEYLELIKKAKAELSIPVIASINCIESKTQWYEFASQIEQAGADALELNINIVPTDRSKDAAFYENIYYGIVDSVKNETHIPVAVKIGSHFTNILQFVSNLHFKSKADGVVLFNSFYEPDIDIDTRQFTTAPVFTSPKDVKLPLRWIGLLASSLTRFDISASTGVHSPGAAIKLLLSGARSVQVCSVLYEKGIEHLKTIVEGIEHWMQQNNIQTIGEFRGSMSYSKDGGADIYERSQFMKHYSQYQ